MPINIEEIKTIIKEISATNRNDLYNSHIYWSQKPYNIANVLIQELSDRGDVVFDPFLGSGVTVLEAINKKNQRSGIGCELNETPLFIVKTLLNQYDLKKYDKQAKLLLDKLNIINSHYYTTCTSCGNVGVINKVVFDKPSRKAKNKIKVVEYSCDHCGKKMVKNASTDDYERMNVTVYPKHIVNLKLIPNSKIAVYEDSYILDIFTNRNFMVLDEVLTIIEELDEYNDVFKYIVMSIIHLSKITDKRSNSQWPLWIPKKDCVEKNIVQLISKKISNFRKTIKYVNKHYEKPHYTLLHKGSQHITVSDIENNSVDLIITDPPYMGQVAYSEYMQLYKPFLGLDFDLENEIVVTNNAVRKKGKEEYFELFAEVFRISALKLKEDKYMCMYFHDSNLDVWNKLINIMNSNRLRYISQVHIKKSNTLKNILSPKKSLNGDAVLFFVKDSNHRRFDAADEPLSEIISNVILHIKHSIRNNGPMSTPELYDYGLMEYLIYNNWLEPLSKKYSTMIPIFEKHLIWDKELGKWKL